MTVGRIHRGVLSRNSSTSSHDDLFNYDLSRIDSQLSRLDADRERKLIFDSQLAEVTDRSLRIADVADVELT